MINKTVVNPPAVVVVNPPSTSTETTTKSTTTGSGQSAGSIQEKEQSKTTYGPKLKRLRRLASLS